MNKLFFAKNLIKDYNKSGIYSIKINNKEYIGSSICIGKRLSTHRSRLLRNKHENVILLNHFNKYGINSCTFEVLEYCNKEILLLKEKEYIDKNKPKLNIELNPILQNGNYKTKKVYQYSLNRVFIKKFNSASEAERFFNKASNKISLCCLNKRKSAYKYLWSYSKKKPSKYINNSKTSKNKQVNQYDLNGDFIKSFISIADAVKHLSLKGNFASNCTMISACCLNKITKAFNFIWKY